MSNNQPHNSAAYNKTDYLFRIPQCGEAQQKQVICVPQSTGWGPETLGDPRRRHSHGCQVRLTVVGGFG